MDNRRYEPPTVELFLGILLRGEAIFYLAVQAGRLVIDDRAVAATWLVHVVGQRNEGT